MQSVSHIQGLQVTGSGQIHETEQVWVEKHEKLELQWQTMCITSSFILHRLHRLACNFISVSYVSNRLSWWTANLLCTVWIWIKKTFNAGLMQVLIRSLTDNTVQIKHHYITGNRSTDFINKCYSLGQSQLCIWHYLLCVSPAMFLGWKSP